MTRVEFHFNMPERLAYACRLLRKASRSGMPAVVTGDDATLRRLDTLLWTFEAQSFVPHCMDDAPAHVLAASSIVLTGDASGAPHAALLVNVGDAVPAGFERFDRLIEIAADDGREAARARWRHYAQRGYAIERRDLRAPEVG